MMKADKEKVDELVPSQSATLSKSGATALAARGRADLRNKEEAVEWLHKGLELQSQAYNDPGLRSICESQETSKKEHADRTLLAADYLKRVAAGDDSDSVAKSLNLTPEVKDFALTMGFFFPNSISLLVDNAKIEVQKHGEVMKKYDQRLCEAFHCFERGIALDPNNLELISNLADCYSVGLGVEEDETKAYFLLRKAAERGLFTAQTALGYHYVNSLRRNSDKELAAYWFHKAAEQGDTIAIHALRRFGLNQT